MLPFSHCEHVLLEKSEEKTSEEHTSEVFSPSGSRAPLHRGFPTAEHGLPPVTLDGCERNEGRVQAVLSEPSPHGLKRPEPPAILSPQHEQTTVCQRPAVPTRTALNKIKRHNEATTCQHGFLSQSFTGYQGARLMCRRGLGTT